MSQYNNTKFYWLQLQENFFDNDYISWLEEQPNGKEYCLFYLKLCVKFLKTNGILRRQVGTMIVPYDLKKLAEITHTDFDTAVVAMDLLKKIGLIDILDSGELYLTQLETMIGSKSVGAFKKQQQRLAGDNSKKLLETAENDKGGQMSAKCPQNCPPELELEQELELEKEIENKDIDKHTISNDKTVSCETIVGGKKEKVLPLKNKYGKFNHVLLSKEEYEKLKADYGEQETERAIAYLDEYIESKGSYKCKSHNLALRRWVFLAVREHEQREARVARPYSTYSKGDNFMDNLKQAYEGEM